MCVKRLILFFILSAEVLATYAIINGTSATVDTSHGYTVAIRRNGTTNDCSGTIISERYVLTAAHCVQGNSDFEILLGLLPYNDTNRSKQVVPKGNAKAYSLYAMSPLILNDVAVIQLVEPLILGSTIFAAQISCVTPAPGTSVTVVGAGLTQETPPVEATGPNYMNAEVIPKYDCIKDNPLAGVRPLTFCTQGIGVSACGGDSGAGAVVFDGVSFKIVGVLSYGEGGYVSPACTPGSSNGFTSIGYDMYLKFISDNTQVQCVR